MSKELPDIGTSWHGNFKFRKLQIYFPGGRVKGTESQKKILCPGPNHQYILLLCILVVGSRAQNLEKKDFVPGTQPPIYSISIYIGGWVPGTESQKKIFCALIKKQFNSYPWPRFISEYMCFDVFKKNDFNLYQLSKNSVLKVAST